MNGFPTAFGIILVLHTILDDFELQLSHGAHDFATVELVNKQLRHPLIHQLIQSLLKLFAFHGIVILNIFKQQGREARQATEM